ncbi:MAG TPA: hypothetical protein VLN48_18470, partial [Bryobacteraceae bacterium]|nr:hypothetical protein [Bryobacteraceae bacterium]
MLGLRLAIPVFAITTFLVAPLRATTSYYAANQAGFNTAVGGLTLLNPGLLFSGADLGSGGLYNASNTGIDFLGFDTAFSFNSPLSFTVNAGKLTATNSNEVVKIVLPAAGVFAFGFHITVTSGSGNWCIDLTQGGCTYNLLNSSPSDVQFFGVVSDTPITAPLYIHYAGGNPTIVLPDFEAYGAASVPESRTMLLVGLG